MKELLIGVVVAVAVSLRLLMYVRRRNRRLAEQGGGASDGMRPALRGGGGAGPFARLGRAVEGGLGDAGIVAVREIRERIRGRIFRVGTLLILAVVAAAIIIPKVTSSGSGSGANIQTVGIVGGLSPSGTALVTAAAKSNQDGLKLISESSLAQAKADLKSGKIDFAIYESKEVLLEQPATAKGSPADPSLVANVADYLGVLIAYRSAGLTAAQAETIDNSKPVPVVPLQPSSGGSTKAGSVIGLVLLFVMLSQYNTWILMGVMQEKSSRVVEVLLATLRPISLLGGKVLGIGVVALSQAALIVGFALALGAALGSDLVSGSQPLVLLCELLWLLLGYAFYCWVYAAAGSTAERQDQVQTLALPLSIPILIGYIFSITVVSTGNASIFYEVLAYLPPTAPFCMPVLVALHDVAWWQFVASMLISIGSTVGVALFAARIYRRAVLQTGGRVRLRQLLARA